MTFLNNNYRLFGLLVSIIVCACLIIILARVIKNRQYTHLSWALPMALGNIVSSTGAFLYVVDPQPWANLARQGIYPLFITGLIAGFLMIYGWIRFVLIFFNSNALGETLPRSSITIETQEEVWPPPPNRPD